MTREEIEAEHDRLGCRNGWRFIMCPEATFWSARLIVVGLNPGGMVRHGTDWSSEAANAYWQEEWEGRAAGTDPLQRQVQLLAAVNGVDEASVGCAQFVPFRSNDWAGLPRRAEAIVFSRQLWTWVLSNAEARTYACLGKQIVGREVAALLNAAPVGEYDVGWGSQTVQRYEAEDGRAVIALPHLGRFRLFGRPQSEAALRAAFALSS